MVLCVGLYYYRLIRSQHRQWFNICLSPVAMSRSKGLRPTKLFSSHKWHSRVNSKLEQLSRSRPRRLSEQQDNHGVTFVESSDDRHMPGQGVKIRIRSVHEWLLLNIKVKPLNNLIHAAIILFYNGTSAKLSMVSRRGCWPNTTCHLTATLLAWGATSLWWLTSLAQFLLQDPEFSSVFGSSRS